MAGFLTGYRTYISVGLAAAAYAAFLAGLMTHEQLTTILTGLGFSTAAFLRAAIARQPEEVAKKVEEKIVPVIEQPLMPEPPRGKPK